MLYIYVFEIELLKTVLFVEIILFIECQSNHAVTNDARDMGNFNNSSVYMDKSNNVRDTVIRI